MPPVCACLVAKHAVEREHAAARARRLVSRVCTAGVLPREACAALREAVDANASLLLGTTDAMPEHTLHVDYEQLQGLIGHAAAATLSQLPARYRRQAEAARAGAASGGGVAEEQAPVLTECFIRRFSAETRPWIKIHADVAAVTVNVALTGDDEYPGGGQLLGVYDGAVRAVERRAGDVTVHPSSLLHGVSRMHAGARYTLILFFE